MIKTAIIVLNFNGKECLPRCLASLEKIETQEDFTVVVVDNASSDTSLVSAQEDFPQYTYIKNPVNLGFAAGMNIGIRWALERGYDFVWLMNYDATVFPDTLEKLLLAANSKEKKDIMSPVIVGKDGAHWFSGGKINYFCMRTEHFCKPVSPLPYVTDFLTGCALFVRAEIFKENGLLDERFFLYYEDAEFSARLKRAGYKLWIVPESRVWHEEKSVENPKKLYYLVYYGLLFFAIHTPSWLRLYIVGYVTIRRAVNLFKCFTGAKNSQQVYQAYADYFTTFQPKNKLYLRKLPQRKIA